MGGGGCQEGGGTKNDNEMMEDQDVSHKALWGRKQAFSFKQCFGVEDPTVPC